MYQFIITSVSANLSYEITINLDKKTVTHCLVNDDVHHLVFGFNHYAIDDNASLSSAIELVIEYFNESILPDGEEWFEFNEMSLNSQIEKFRPILEENFIIDSFTVSEGEIEIKYSFNLEYASKILSYNLEDWNEDAPETFDLEGTITIEHENGLITSYEQHGSIGDCVDSKRNGGFDGFQFDYNLDKSVGRPIAEYLSGFVGELRDTPYENVDESDRYEILFEDETNPHNAYNNQYVKVARRDDKIFVSVTDNHQAHNHNDLQGRSEWTPIEKWEEISEKRFLSQWGEYFEFSQELIDILNGNN